MRANLLGPGGTLLFDEKQYQYKSDGSPSRFTPVTSGVAKFVRKYHATNMVRGYPCGRVLDIGCGAGEMLNCFGERGWEVWGVEPDRKIAGVAKEVFGNRILECSVEEVPKDLGPFDLIVLWHVLEHLDDPIGVVSKLAGRLTPGGRIIISLPNIASLQARFAGPLWLHLDVPRHRFHFSVKSIRGLAQKVGVRVAKVTTFSPEYGPFALLQGILARIGLGNFLFRTMVRPGGATGLLGRPLFWAHVALLPVILALVVVSVVVEVLASAFGQGATLTVELKKG